MPRIKSAQKALRQNIKRRKRNDEKSALIKKMIKKINQFVIGKKKDEAQKLLPQAYKLIDKAVKTNIFKKNTAARKKSNLAKLISKA